MRRHVPALILATLVLAAPAAAAPSAAKPKLAVDLQKVGHIKRNVVFAGKSFRVRGTVTPYVAGQSVRVRLYLGKKMLSVKTKKIRPIGTSGQGVFTASFKTNLRGRFRMGITHDGTPALGYFHATAGPILVVRPEATYGDTGFSVHVLQRLLRDVGYVPGHPGTFDQRTGRAVMAFRKVSGLTRIESASRTVFRRLINGGGVFQVRYPNQGHHVEADLTHQVLALIDHGKVERIYPISSGAPWTPTILGSFRVYLKAPGTNAKGMVHSSYFIRGYAIHGYASVPPYPASHGCLRVPVPDAWSIFEWVQYGDYVDTYYRSGKHRSGKAGAKNVGP